MYTELMVQAWIAVLMSTVPSGIHAAPAQRAPVTAVYRPDLGSISAMFQLLENARAAPLCCAELYGETARRFSKPLAPGRRPQLDACLGGAWSLIDTAMRRHNPAGAEVLILAAVETHRRYTAPGALRTAGFLHFIFRKLAPREAVGRY